VFGERAGPVFLEGVGQPYAGQLGVARQLGQHPPGGLLAGGQLDLVFLP
jgi:hypothetical protein